MMILKAALFGRMVVMGQSRHSDMKELLRYPLGPLPWSLATPDGRLRKTNKSSLAKSIHKSCSFLVDSLPQYYATVVDGMALVQRAKVTQQTTFEDVADLIFKMVINEASLSTRLDMFDRFWDKSTKYPERVLSLIHI